MPMTTNVCRAHKLNPDNVTTPDCTRKRAPEMSNREPYITSKSPFHNSKEPLISHKGAITKQFTLYIAREPGEPRKTTPACYTCGTSPYDTQKRNVLTVSSTLHTQQSQLDRTMSTTMCRAHKLSPNNACESTYAKEPFHQAQDPLT